MRSVRRTCALVLTLALGTFAAACSSSHALSSRDATTICFAKAADNGGASGPYYKAGGGYFVSSVSSVAEVRETDGSKVPGLAKFLQPLSASSQVVTCQTLRFGGGGTGGCKGGASRRLVTPDKAHTFTYPCAFVNESGLTVPTT